VLSKLTRKFRDKNEFARNKILNKLKNNDYICRKRKNKKTNAKIDLYLNKNYLIHKLKLKNYIISYNLIYI